MIITATALFSPSEHIRGDKFCYYCGADCDDRYTTKEYVKSTFTNRDIVKRPSSQYVCGCCVASMATIVTTTLIDGEVKTGRGGAPRLYSWMLSKYGNVAFSKKHLDYARSILTNPPKPPFSIVLSDSGKKHIIFRAPVNFDRSVFSVQIEDEQCEIRIPEFSEILELATIVSAAIGKKSLAEPTGINALISFHEFYGSESELEKWIEICNTPMAKVAAFVCKGRDDARIEEFVMRRIQKKTSWSCGQDSPKPEQKPRQRKGSSNRIGFDFA